MDDRKIRFEPSADGKWLAVVGSVGVDALTPWEASAAVCSALGEDLPIEWQTLPWTAQREAHGITQGVCELLGAGRDARRAIAKAKWVTAGRFWLCWRCREPAPTDAEECGWRYGSRDVPGEPDWDGWLCPPCQADMPGANTATPPAGGGEKKRKRGRR